MKHYKITLMDGTVLFKHTTQAASEFLLAHGELVKRID